MEPKITVIVPTYNNEPWLPSCLDSILEQTYRNLEILVVNDGSEDNTRQILEEYARRDERIRPIHKKNAGLPSARMRGITEATGDWITFVDGDDEIEPQMYEHLMKNALEYDADISHCGYVMIYPDGQRVYYTNSGVIRIQDHLMGLKDLLEETLIQPSACNKLYKRTLFVDLEGKCPEDIWNNEDMLLNFYLFRNAKRSVFEDFCPYHYRLREGSLSRRKPNAHTIYDPIRVKQCILRDCEPELRDDAHRAMAETCLFAYAQICRGMKKEYAEDRRIVRSIIRKLRPYLSILSFKNAVMVWFVSYIPVVFHMVYAIYYNCLKRK